MWTPERDRQRGHVVVAKARAQQNPVEPRRPDDRGRGGAGRPLSPLGALDDRLVLLVRSEHAGVRNQVGDEANRAQDQRRGDRPGREVGVEPAQQAAGDQFQGERAQGNQHGGHVEPDLPAVHPKRSSRLARSRSGGAGQRGGQAGRGQGVSSWLGPRRPARDGARGSCHRPPVIASPPRRGRAASTSFRPIALLDLSNVPQIPVQSGPKRAKWPPDGCAQSQ